jgi:hypothetical protein
VSARSSATSTRSRPRSAAGGRRRLVLCIDNGGYEASLASRKFYLALSDPDAEAHGQVRVIDESGEDYLYPASRFTEIALPPSVRRRLLRAV